MAIILKYIDNNLDAKEFIQILKRTSIDLGNIGKDNYYGYGLINLKNAVNLIEEG